MSGSDDDKLLHRYGWSADEIKRMSPNQRQAALDECLKQAHEGSVKEDSGELDAPLVFRGPENIGSPLPKLKQRRAHKWLALVVLLAVAAGATVYFRGLNRPTQSKIRSDSACGRGGWKTSITLDNTRPELVSSTLRSENDLGPPSEPACVDVTFACGPDGPYFEVRIDSMIRRIIGIGPIVVGRTGDDLNLSVSGLPSEDGRAIRVSQRTGVEVLASELMDGYGFTILIRFADGDDAVAEFASLLLFPAIRPILLACKMRYLRSSAGATEEPE
jgi:hypothetical protein